MLETLGAAKIVSLWGAGFILGATGRSRARFGARRPIETVNQVHCLKRFEDQKALRPFCRCSSLKTVHLVIWPLLEPQNCAFGDLAAAWAFGDLAAAQASKADIW